MLPEKQGRVARHRRWRPGLLPCALPQGREGPSAGRGVRGSEGGV